MDYTQSFTIYAPVQTVWQALTDPTVIDHWNTGPAEMDPHVGGHFSIYDGDVHGTNTEIVPNELLRQDWYGDDAPDRKYDVTFTFHAVDAQTTQVTVSHNLYGDDFESMSSGWLDYYFKPIKQLVEKQTSSRIKLQFVDKEHVVDNVWSFRFKPTVPLSWTGGQYIWVELLHENPDGEGMRRWFSIASAPYEELVEITTRVSNSTFKQALASMHEDDELALLEKPDGDFIWHDSDTPLVFVAGGIGITAFHSMLKQRFHENLPMNVTLLYGTRDDQVPFKGEIDTWAASHPEFSVRYITGAQLNVDGLTALQPNILSSLLYLSGPEAMVEALGDEFIAKGLPQSQLRLDALEHYTGQSY